MDITEREAGDVQRLEELIDEEQNAKQRDRYRMALLAVRGWEANDIAEALSSNRRTVQEWAYRYRDGGIPGLSPGKAPGNKSLLPPEQHEAFRQRIINGPRESDGVCTLRGKDDRNRAVHRGRPGRPDAFGRPGRRQYRERRSFRQRRVHHHAH